MVNPFDKFPKTYAYNSSMNMTFTVKGLEPFRDWREKWESIIVEAMEVLGAKACPNCGKIVFQFELEENRGVCGLCYESLSSNSPQKILGVESS